MLIAWRYRERDTLIQRLDPRARLIFMLCATGATYMLWDIRWVVPMFALALAQYLLARIPFRQARTFWLVIGLLAVSLSVLTALTGSRLTGYVTELHPIYEGRSFRVLFWTLTPRLSAEQVAFLAVQVVRILTFALLAVVIPYTINPALYGITFRGLGVPDKFAYAMDLAFRLVPSMGRDFQLILDAQRARAYELDRLRGGLVEKTRRLAPLMVPLVVGAIVSGEDIIDAMDLRAFGVGKRTWRPELRYRRADLVLMGFSFALLAVVVAAKLMDLGDLWVPPWLLRMAG